MSTVILCLRQRVGVFPHVSIEGVIVGKYVAAGPAEGESVASFANDVVLNQILRRAELQKDGVIRSAVVVICVVQVVVADFAAVHIRQINVGLVHRHIALNAMNPAIGAGHHVYVLKSEQRT